MVKCSGYAVNKIQNSGVISCYAFSQAEAEGLVVDFCTMLQFLVAEYIIVLFLYIPLSYTLGVPIYLMSIFFIFANPLHLLGAVVLN